MNTYQTLLATTRSFTYVGIKSIARTALLTIASNPVTTLLVSASILFVTWVVYSLRSKIDTQPKASSKTHSHIGPRNPKDKAGEPELVCTPASNEEVTELKQKLDSLKQRLDSLYKESATNHEDVFSAIDSLLSVYKVRFGDDKIEEILAQFANDKSEDELEKYSEPLVCPRLLNDIKTDSGYLVAPQKLEPMGIRITSRDAEGYTPLLLNNSQYVSTNIKNFRLGNVIGATAKHATQGSTIQHSKTNGTYTYSNTAYSSETTVDIWSLDMPTFYYINSALRKLGSTHGYKWKGSGDINIKENKWDQLPNQENTKVILFKGDDFKSKSWTFLSDFNCSNENGFSATLMEYLHKPDNPAIRKQQETFPLATPYVSIDLDAALKNIETEECKDSNTTTALSNEIRTQIGQKANKILHTFVDLFNTQQDETSQVKEKRLKFAIRLKKQMFSLFQECNPKFPLYNISAKSSLYFRKGTDTNPTLHNPCKSLASNILDLEIFAAKEALLTDEDTKLNNLRTANTNSADRIYHENHDPKKALS